MQHNAADRAPEFHFVDISFQQGDGAVGYPLESPRLVGALAMGPGTIARPPAPSAPGEFLFAERAMKPFRHAFRHRDEFSPLLAGHQGGTTPVFLRGDKESTVERHPVGENTPGKLPEVLMAHS